MLICLLTNPSKDHDDSVLITPTEVDDIDGDVFMEFVHICKDWQR